MYNFIIYNVQFYNLPCTILNVQFYNLQCTIYNVQFSSGKSDVGEENLAVNGIGIDAQEDVGQGLDVTLLGVTSKEGV